MAMSIRVATSASWAIAAGHDSGPPLPRPPHGDAGEDRMAEETWHTGIEAIGVNYPPAHLQ
jgi:hypothetical protein